MVVTELTKFFEWYGINPNGTQMDNHKRKNLGTVVMHLANLDRPTADMTNAELKRIDRLGDETLHKIREIEKFGHLKVMQEERLLTKMDEAMIKLRKIHGVGKGTAKDLVTRAGIRTVDQLRQAVDAGSPEVKAILSEPAYVGLQFFDDVEQRIPRRTVEALGTLIIEVAQALIPGCQGHICGSYRRGAETSGDVDVVLCDETGLCVDILSVVTELKRRGVITHDLSHFDEVKPPAWGNADEASKWMGLGVAPGETTQRRLDIYTCPRHELAFMLIFLTGSEFLQRILRLRARKIGWSMSQHGFRVSKLDPDSKLKRVIDGTLTLPCRTEREVFERLDLPYLEPTERNLGNRKLSGWCPAVYKELASETTELPAEDSQATDLDISQTSLDSQMSPI